jgi:hypothetical protein
MKKKITIVVLALLAILAAVVVLLRGNKPQEEPVQPVPAITVIADTFEAREEPLTGEEVFKVDLGAEITYEPETLDISQPGEYVFKIKVVTEEKEFTEEVTIKVVEKLEVIEEEPEVDDTGCEHKFGTLFNSEGWSKWETIKEATCLTSGTKERTRTCSKCGYVQKETAIIQATGHKMDKGTVTKEATCTEAGKKVYTCTVCGSTSEEVILALGHDWDKGTVTKEPTCTQEGTKTTTCKRCGLTETQSIPAKGHSFGNWTQTVAPTCTQDGKETRKCSSCEHTEERVVAKLGHNYSAWNTTKEPTCTTTGTKERTCSRCSDKQVETIPALGHSYGSWTTTKQPTCSEEGIKERTCSRCGNKETQSIPMLEHQWEDWQRVQEPTCSQQGLEQKGCKVCGYSEKRRIQALGHEPTYVNPKTEQEVSYRIKCNKSGCTWTCEGNSTYVAEQYALHSIEAQHYSGYANIGTLIKPRCSRCGEILWDYPGQWQ